MPRSGRLYVMRIDEECVKVGFSASPDRRSKELGRLEIAYQSDWIDQVETIERNAHRLLRVAGKHVKNEVFRASIEEALAAIKQAMEIADGKELPADVQNKGLTSVFQARVNNRDLEMLDTLRKAEPDLPSRSEMVRRLIVRSSPRSNQSSEKP